MKRKQRLIIHHNWLKLKKENGVNIQSIVEKEKNLKKEKALALNTKEIFTLIESRISFSFLSSLYCTPSLLLFCFIFPT